MIVRFLAAALILIGVFHPVLAQSVIEARFSADNGSPLVGEPVTLTLTANVPQGIAITAWPEIPADWSPFEVRGLGELSITENPDGTALYQQPYTVILWDVGEYETPDTIIQYEVIGDGTTREQNIEPAFFTVISVLDPADMTLRPFQPPVLLPYISPLLIAGVAGGAVALLALVVQRVWRGQTSPARPTPGALTPAKLALTELRRLAGRNLTPVQLYQAVADALRTYTQAQYQVQALDMTTGELMDALYNRIPGSTQTDLQRMLDQADLVKFARYIPDADSAQKYLESAGRWLKAQDDE